ncbi:hypothetical protein Droror1_Dr00011329 [Drosera rotundifolia]
MLPDRHCLWEVPLVGCSDKVIVYCGLHDNPKALLSKDGTFCGRPWKKVLLDLGIQETNLWNSTCSNDKCLWNAKLFPILPCFEILELASWLMGLTDQKDESVFRSWGSSSRVSLEELHRSIDFPSMCLVSSQHQAGLAASIARACIDYGLLGPNLSQLCDEILQDTVSGVETCRKFLGSCPVFKEHLVFRKILPGLLLYFHERLHQSLYSASSYLKVLFFRLSFSATIRDFVGNL